MKPVSPVIDGLQEQEILIAKDQPEYGTLPALKADEGYILSRWEVTDEDLANITKTRSVYLYLDVGEGPVPPMSLETAHPIKSEQELIDNRS